MSSDINDGGGSGFRDDGSGSEVSEEVDAADVSQDVAVEAQEQDASGVAAGIPFSFVDAHGTRYETMLNDQVPMHSYDWSLLSREGSSSDAGMSYDDPSVTLRFGIDVSHHQGEIDWQQAAQAGVEFAFVRIAYRGYGPEGNLRADQRGIENLDQARAAGIQVGVYIFSQAINEEEAAEEADFVLDLLDGRTLDLPVVFDPELILDDEARTDGVSGEQFTANTRLFCDRMREAGYQAMIYSNMYWEAFLFDMEVLSDLPVWYADYELVPQTPYQFTFWQYSEKGNVPGVEGIVDLDVWFVPAGVEE